MTEVGDEGELRIVLRRPCTRVRTSLPNMGTRFFLVLNSMVKG